MQYMLLIYGDEKLWDGLPAAEVEKIMRAYVDYSKALAAAGVRDGGAELAPVGSATTVRVRDGEILLTDGPFAETKEQLGGYYVIDVPTFDAALGWAAKIPSALYGSIEIRPQTQNQALAAVVG